MGIPRDIPRQLWVWTTTVEVPFSLRSFVKIKTSKSRQVYKMLNFSDVMHRDTFVFGGQISLLYPTTGAVLHFLLSAFARKRQLLLQRRQHESAMRFQDSRILFVPWVCFCLPRCSAVVTVTVGKYPPNIIPNKYFCIKISHFDNDKHYID